MLVQFTFGNFRSFKESATFSMIAASKLQADPALDAGNVFAINQYPRLSLLRVAAIYGANASGKTNIVLALQDFRQSILESANVGFLFPQMPFYLDVDSRTEPMLFELTFILEGAQYRYGFEIQSLPQQHTEILSEWLYRATSSKETVLFERVGDKVDKKRGFSEGNALLKDGHLKRKDALFLSLTAQIGGEISYRVIQYLSQTLQIISGLHDKSLRSYTEDCLEHGTYKEVILDIIRNLDTGIADIKMIKEEEVTLSIIDPSEQIDKDFHEMARRQYMLDLKISAIHPVFDKLGNQVETMIFPMPIFESQGTQKLFALAGPIAATLASGSILVIDEIEARFHPLLTQALVRLFQSSHTNPHNAQLIFITHDTNLLDKKRFRRDQIWFVEKDRLGASHVYSLAEFKGIRKDESFEENYILGKYGAIPFVGDMNKIFESDPEISINAKA